MNPLAREATHVLNAIASLKLKRARLVSTSRGIEIQQVGRPTLLLTYEAAHRWANEIEEAEA